VREGYRVIEEQIRRGRRMAQTLGEEDRSDHPSREGRRPRPGRREEEGGRLFARHVRRIEKLTREILRQIASGRPDPLRVSTLFFRLLLEAFSDLAVLGFDAMGALAPRADPFEEDVLRIERDCEESCEELEEELDEEEEPWDEPLDWPPAPSVPTVIRSTVPIPVCVWSHERTEVDLELPAGAPSLDLVVEPPLATGTDQPALPPFSAELVALADGPVILRIEVPRDLPAGRYRRRVLVRATGEPVGDLTVQVGVPSVVTVPPVAAAPKKGPKKGRKR
jgi:hypothetical protein